MKIQYKMQNGAWVNESDQAEIDKMIDCVINNTPVPVGRERATREMVLRALAKGKTLQYGPDWYSVFRDADALKPALAQPEETATTCDCGHTVAKSLVMNASLGTSCPDCYDRMSE